MLQACRWLLAPLRHRQFFSLAELNLAIALLLAELNDKPMAAPREGSRRSLFEAVERGALKLLPIEPYVVGHWAVGAIVNVDYHVPVDRNFYSVPLRTGAQTRRCFRHAQRGADFPSRRTGGQPCRGKLKIGVKSGHNGIVGGLSP